MLSQPLTPAVLLLVAGILAGRFVTAPLSVLLPLGISGILLMRWKKIRRPALYFCIFMAGWSLYTSRFEIRRADDLRVIIGTKPAIAKIAGEIVESPNVRVYEEAGRKKETSLTHVRVARIELAGKWQQAFGDVMVAASSALPTNFFAGEKVVIDGIIALPSPALAEGLFDFRHYLEIQRIFYEVKTESAAAWTLSQTNSTPAPLTFRFQQWAASRLARGMPVESETFQLLATMILANKTSGNPELSLPFMRTGTLHIFAISGLHIACIAGALVTVLSLGGIPRHASAWITLPLIWFYTAATGWQSSAIRSVIMSSIVILGWALKRPTNLLNSLAAAALLILAWQPEQLFQASFQLSFAVVLSIGLFLPMLDGWRKKLLAPDPFLPSSLVPEWRRRLEGPIEFLSANLALSIAACIGALPVVAYYFNLVTPNSLLANLVAVPLSSLSLLFGLAGLVSPWPIPFNWLSWAMMDDVARCMDWLARMPGGFFYVPKPGLPFFLFYYGLLVLFLTGAYRKSLARKLLLSVITLGCAGGLIQLISIQNESRLTMLPIRGTPVLVDLPGSSKDMLIDCSSQRDSEHVLARFLRAQGYNSIHSVILSVGETAHVQGWDVIAREFKPAEVVVSKARFRSPAYKTVTESIKHDSTFHLGLVSRGASIDEWQVLHPSEGEKLARAEDKSMVLFTKISGLRILLLSELGHLGQNGLMNAFPNLKADIVLAGMPGGSEPMEDELIEQLSPQLIVLGTLQYPIRSQGSRELRQRLQKHNIPLFFTSDCGAVTLRFDSQGCVVNAMNGDQRIIRKRE